MAEQRGGVSKRLFTNSMLGAWRTCKAKYRWSYIEELAPLKVSRPLRYGDLVHLLLQHMYLGVELEDLWPIAETWVTEKVDQVVTTLQESRWANVLAPEEVIRLPLETEAEARGIFDEVKGIVTHYHSTQYAEDKDKLEPLLVERRFEVPFVDRYDRRHKTWRYSGKWDLIARYRDSGRILIIDHKTTINQPQNEAMNFNLSTQPVAYSYAGLYLATLPMKSDLAKVTLADEGLRRQAEKAIEPDAPFWPKDIPPPDGFAVNVIRKKVPKKPPLLKSKTKDGKPRISKAQGVDTTHELYLEAILENGLNPDDYQDVLDRLEKRGDVFHYREELAVGPEELRRWVEETRIELENIQRAERDPANHCTRTSGACNVFSLCPYHPLCWGDEQAARGAFRHRPAHAELAEQ